MSSAEECISSGLPQGQGLWVQQTSVLHKPSWRRSSLTPSTEPPELTQDWGNRLLEGANKTCVHQVPGERSSDPTRDRPRLALEHPGVSGGGIGRQWPGAGLGALSAPDPAAGHRQPTPLLETPGHSGQVWVSFLWDHCSFLLGPGVHKVLFVPSKSLFP